MSLRLLPLAMSILCSFFLSCPLAAEENLWCGTETAPVSERPIVPMPESIHHDWHEDHNNNTLDCAFQLPEGLVFEDSYGTKRSIDSKAVQFINKFVPTGSVQFVSDTGEVLEFGEIYLTVQNDLENQRILCELKTINRFTETTDDYTCVDTQTTTQRYSISDRPLNLDRNPRGFTYDNEGPNVVGVEFYYQ